MRHVTGNLAKVVLTIALLPSMAGACPACRANAASADPHTQRGLQRGVIVLLVPTLGALAGLAVLVYRHRDA